jgi:hypothetical protein
MAKAPSERGGLWHRNMDDDRCSLLDLHHAAHTLNDTATCTVPWPPRCWAARPATRLLTVVEQLTPPVVQSQPGNLNVSVGGSAVFGATVSGTAPLSYQWRRDGANLIGANSAMLTLAPQRARAGRYDLVVQSRRQRDQRGGGAGHPRHARSATDDRCAACLDHRGRGQRCQLRGRSTAPGRTPTCG